MIEQTKPTSDETIYFQQTAIEIYRMRSGLTRNKEEDRQPRVLFEYHNIWTGQLKQAQS